mmetsp:Transcript_50251/g.157042  ORF Transcript_50251/g.157042 Transcript_50251/m.157042 type:complete len:272 (+) Transcript_50251:421-1236(+)
MLIHSIPVHCILHSLDLRHACPSQQVQLRLCCGAIQVCHGLDERNRVARDGPYDFRSPVEELAGVSSLCAQRDAAVQAVVGKLKSHLHEGIRRHLALLNETFPKVSHVEDMQVCLRDQLLVLDRRLVNRLGDIGGELPLQPDRLHFLRPSLSLCRVCRAVVVGDGEVEGGVLVVVHEAEEMGSHWGVSPGPLDVDTGRTVLVHDQLERLVEPAVAPVADESHPRLFRQRRCVRAFQDENKHCRLDDRHRALVLRVYLEQLETEPRPRVPLL